MAWMFFDGYWQDPDTGQMSLTDPTAPQSAVMPTPSGWQIGGTVNNAPNSYYNPQYQVTTNYNPSAGPQSEVDAWKSLYQPTLVGLTNRAGGQDMMRYLIGLAPDQYAKYGIDANNIDALMAKVERDNYDVMHNVNKDDFLDQIGMKLAFAPHLMGLASLAGFGNMFGPPGVQSAGADGLIGDGGGFDQLLPDEWTKEAWQSVSNSGGKPMTFNLDDYYNAIDEAQSFTNGVTAPSPTLSIPGYGDIYGSMPSILKNLPGLSSLFGSGGGGLSSMFGSGQQSGLFGSLFGNNGLTSVLDRGIASAPVLAAIQYARNQDPLDTSRLEGLYNQFNPNALAYQYDQNTALGRGALTDSLTNRGVMGSSFGDQSLTNFNTSRDLGRSSLLNQGIGQQADIAGRIADMNFKSRQLKNQLYGSSLLALGNVFGGRSSPTINFGGV